MSTPKPRQKLGEVLRSSMCGRGGEGAEDQQHPRDDGSHYSLTAGLLPPLGATAFKTRHVKLRPFIVSPFDPRYKFTLPPFLSFLLPFSLIFLPLIFKCSIELPFLFPLNLLPFYFAAMLFLSRIQTARFILWCTSHNVCFIYWR